MEREREGEIRGRKGGERTQVQTRTKRNRRIGNTLISTQTEQRTKE